jgi:undecaprenyl-diphosphatase
MKPLDAISIGLFQLLSVFPGISRSGSTITAGLLRGMTGPESVRYSFLLSIPVLIAAVLVESLDLSKSKPMSSHSIKWDWIITGLTASFVAGILSLKVLVWLGKKVLFYPFGIYTIVLSVILMFFY